MHSHSKSKGGIWAAVVVVSVFLLGFATYATATREVPPIATVRVNDSTSMDMVAVLTATNRRVDLSPLSRRLFWKLPRSLRSAVYAFGKPAPSQMVRAFDIGPRDVKLVFVGKGMEGGGATARAELKAALIFSGRDDVRLTAGPDWQSEVVHLREEPVKGPKIIRTAQFDDVPTTPARLRLEFVGRPVMEKRDPADGAVKAVGHVEIPNPHYRGR